MSEAVFDVVAEDPEIEHVARDVGEPAVHEHRCDHVRQLEARRDQSEGEDEQPLVVLGQAGLQDEDHEVEHQQSDGDDGPRAGRDDIAKGDHTASIVSSADTWARTAPPPRLLHDLPELRNRDRSKGPDLLSMRHGDDRAAHQAARGAAPLQPVAIAPGAGVARGGGRTRVRGHARRSGASGGPRGDSGGRGRGGAAAPAWVTF